MYEDKIYASTGQARSGFFEILEDGMYSTLSFLRVNGWSLLGVVVVGLILWNWLQPRLQAWRRAWEDAAHHKDPDAVLARERRLRAAREALQRQQLEASRRAAELEAQRKEQKRLAAAELLEKHGVAGGRRLGSDAGFLPLSGGGSTSTYRAPKRSACSGGGCGR